MKHIVWDWNGTLLDDTELCVSIMNGLLRERRKPELSVQYYREIFDFPIKDYYEKAGIDYQRESFDDISYLFIEQYNKDRKKCSLHAGVLEIVKTLKAKNISQSVLSARKHKDLLLDLEDYNLSPFMNYICGIEDHYGGGKLHKANTLQTSLGALPTEITLIGDTTHDFEVAQTMGWNCILISHGHHTVEKLTKTGKQVINSLAELKAYLS